MTRTHPIEMPLTLEARERLRDQQREEAVRLDAVLVAQRRLVAERAKADTVIEKARAGVASKQARVDAAVVGLVEISGLPRVARLLGRTESELAGLVRAEQRRGSPRAGGATAAPTPSS